MIKPGDLFYFQLKTDTLSTAKLIYRCVERCGNWFRPENLTARFSQEAEYSDRHWIWVSEAVRVVSEDEAKRMLESQGSWLLEGREEVLAEIKNFPKRLIEALAKFYDIPSSEVDDHHLTQLATFKWLDHIQAEGKRGDKVASTYLQQTKQSLWNKEVSEKTYLWQLLCIDGLAHIVSGQPQMRFTVGDVRGKTNAQLYVLGGQNLVNWAAWTSHLFGEPTEGKDESELIDASVETVQPTEETAEEPTEETAEELTWATLAEVLKPLPEPSELSDWELSLSPADLLDLLEDSPEECGRIVTSRLAIEQSSEKVIDASVETVQPTEEATEETVEEPEEELTWATLAEVLQPLPEPSELEEWELSVSPSDLLDLIEDSPDVCARIVSSRLALEEAAEVSKWKQLILDMGWERPSRFKVFSSLPESFDPNNCDSETFLRFYAYLIVEDLPPYTKEELSELVKYAGSSSVKDYAALVGVESESEPDFEALLDVELSKKGRSKRAAALAYFLLNP